MSEGIWTMTESEFKQAPREARAMALAEAADDRAVRSETFLATMQNMVGNPGYTHDDIVRYGAYSAEANTTAAWLRRRAVTLRASK